MQRPTSPHYHLGIDKQVYPVSEIFAEGMAGDSSGKNKKWWKRLGVGGRDSAQSKSQDGAHQRRAIPVAPSADSLQGTSLNSRNFSSLLLTYNCSKCRPIDHDSCPLPTTNGRHLNPHLSGCSAHTFGHSAARLSNKQLQRCFRGAPGGRRFPLGQSI